MKLYSSSISDEFLPISRIKEEMRERGIFELKVTEARMMTGEMYFYCTELQEIGEVGEGCGKNCKNDKGKVLYSPRNGKNGRCRFSANCYEDTDKTRIIKILTV